jgi:hypothetical protein
MANSFSPSVNIVRDQEKDSFSYLPTNNSRRIYDLICSNFESGLHSFTIIGSYGTGKSAFIIALEKHLSGQNQYFEPLNGHFNGCNKFEFLNIVGEKDSFLDALANEFGAEASSKDLFKVLKQKQKALEADQACLVIVVDEFGKFLEHAASVDPDRELYFIQQLAEFVNDEQKNILLITTLHQNFDAYAVGLTEAQRKEWEKVKGRLKELAFNEPVEQLLYLASEYINQYFSFKSKSFDRKLLELIKEKRAFALKNKLEEELVDHLFPFDILSAMVLTVALQRYGQNERSLFSFLQAEEHHGLKSFTPSAKTPYYNLAQVYDYLQYNFYQILNSRYNPDFSRWVRLRDAIDRVESSFADAAQVDRAVKIVKTIGLLNILGTNAAVIDQALLSAYSKACLGEGNIEPIVDQLEKQKIIRYQSFRNRYKIFEGTDVDIDRLFKEAREEIGSLENVAFEARPFIHYDYVPAKAATYITGTPRIFRFEVTKEPVLEFDYLEEQETDGIINLLFDIEPDELFDISNQPILYGIFQNTEEVTRRVLDIKAAEKALSSINDDPVAKRELLELKNSQIEQLNELLGEELFLRKNVLWYYEGEEVNVTSKRRLNVMLSKIADDIYSNTPTFRNEHTNKVTVSSPIHNAKRQFIEALTKDWNKPYMGLPVDRFPAEKAIYMSLLHDTGIHTQQSAVTASFSDSPEAPSFEALWKASEGFLEMAKGNRRKLKEFYELLRRPPFRLKDGFLEFWMITFLFVKREDFALFKDGRYLPNLSREVLELLMREILRHEIKTFNIEGVKLDLFNRYRALTQQDEEDKVTASGFQQTAKPFLVFYAQLPKYTQQTRNLSHDALGFRDTIKDAKELEKTFFEDLPACFGLNLNKLSESEDDLRVFVERVQSCIAELRSAYEDLIGRFGEQLSAFFGEKGADFEVYRKKMQKRYKGIKSHLLLPRQRALYNRIFSELPDRAAWLNSIAQALVGKQLSDVSDEEERLLYDRLQSSFAELDNLLELSATDFDEENEEAYQIEITGFNSEPVKRNIILSKRQQKELKEVETGIKKALSQAKDKQLRQAILIKLLKESL